MVHSLLLTNGPEKGRAVVLSDETATLGRDRSNSIVFDDDQVSRLHCEISLQEGGWFVSDVGSSNGTFVNGCRLQNSRIWSGDRLRVGNTRMIFTNSLNSEVASQSFLTDRSNDLESNFGQKLDSDSDSTYRALVEGKGPVEAGRQFVQINNDLRFLYRASLATARKADTLKMLGELMDLIFDWIEADQGYVLLKSPDSTDFIMKLSKKRKTVPGVEAILIIQPIVDFVCEHKVGVLSPTPLDDPRWNLDSNESQPQIGEVICVPIQGQGELLGLIYVDVLLDSNGRSAFRFNEDHLRLLLAMAHQAAVAIEKEIYYTALVEKERMAAVGETAALMSHRINNILQGINGGSHLVQKGLANQDLSIVETGWKTVSGNQEKIAQLISDLLILGKPFEPNKVMVDLNRIAAQALESLKPSFDSANVQCRFIQTGSFEIEADENAIQIAFENLIRLAIEASSHNGQRFVEIGLDQSDESITVEIGYKGAEICFDPKDLTDANGSQPDRVIGGIEFAVSRKIIRGHAGEIVIGRISNGLNRIAINLPKLRFRKFIQQLHRTGSLDTVKEDE